MKKDKLFRNLNSSRQVRFLWSKNASCFLHTNVSPYLCTSNKIYLYIALSWGTIFYLSQANLFHLSVFLYNLCLIIACFSIMHISFDFKHVNIQYRNAFHNNLLSPVVWWHLHRKFSSKPSCGPVGCGCRIHWLNFLYRAKTPAKSVLIYDTKQSDGQASVMVELWGMWSTPLLPSLPSSHKPGVVALDKVLCMG